MLFFPRKFILPNHLIQIIFTISFSQWTMFYPSCPHCFMAHLISLHIMNFVAPCPASSLRFTPCTDYTKILAFHLYDFILVMTMLSCCCLYDSRYINDNIFNYPFSVSSSLFYASNTIYYSRN